MAEGNIIAFSVMSFITQVMISLMLVLAQTGNAWEGQAIQKTISGNLQGDFYQRGNQSVITPEQVNTTIVQPQNPIAAIADYLSMTLNIVGWVWNGIVFVARVGFTYLSLSLRFFQYAAAVGGMGGIVISILAFIIVIWQAATLRYMIKFIAGSKLGI